MPYKMRELNFLLNYRDEKNAKEKHPQIKKRAGPNA